MNLSGVASMEDRSLMTIHDTWPALLVAINFHRERISLKAAHLASFECRLPVLTLLSCGSLILINSSCRPTLHQDKSLRTHGSVGNVAVE